MKKPKIKKNKKKASHHRKIKAKVEVQGHGSYLPFAHVGGLKPCNLWIVSTYRPWEGRWYGTIWGAIVLNSYCL